MDKAKKTEQDNEINRLADENELLRDALETIALTKIKGSTLNGSLARDLIIEARADLWSIHNMDMIDSESS